MISPARLVKNACSSLPLCFKTCPITVTRIPTAAILKIKFTLIEEAGGALFGRSEEENHRRLTLILEQLDDRIKTVRGELGEKQKIYATVSMVMGGMLVILLI